MYNVKFCVCNYTARSHAKEAVYRKADFEIKTSFVNFSKNCNGKIIGLNICGSVQLKSWNAYRLTIWIFRLKTKSMSAYFQPRYYDVVAESIRGVKST